MKRVRAVKLPRFKSERDEAEFWSTHDSTRYWHEFAEVHEPLDLAPDVAEKIVRRTRQKRLISLRLEAWQVRLARAIAARRRVPYLAVIRGWVEEGIRITGAAR